MNKRLITTTVFLLVLTLTGSRGALADDERISITSQGLASEQAAILPGPEDKYTALSRGGDRKQSPRSAEQQKAGVSAATNAAPNTDFWFYDAWVDLYADVDNDGYFTGIDLTFDADTIYGVAEVYAVVYLSYELGPWNEYAVTEDFTILGSSGSDEYFIETDLVAGYPTGDYDILIELFDAFDNAFVASIGPEESSELSLLPLEDMDRDAVETTRVVVNNGGGGSLGWLLLLGLGVAARARR